jgi:hypothetical protein
MPSDYMPTTDAGVEDFGDNFSTLVNAMPGKYALTAAQGLVLADLVADYIAKRTIAVDPSTRTGPSVASKDAAKIALVDYLRLLAGIVQAAGTVSNEDKAALGLTIRSTTPSAILAPGTFALLDVVSAQPLAHNLRFSDSVTPDSRRKPNGAVALELRCEVSATPLNAQEEIGFRALVTRNPAQVNFAAEDIGKQAYYCGRWVTATGQVGPWSSILSKTVTN